ncbi:glycosyl transferase, group 1 [Thiobacillus denitrificans ATCC 25259]|uniref:Glycosyl transferase, group 1 n=1 Tax=Thiobacillus denitrificans (strain ATCC 25259 / T1) TaxID=292415 RepID=Q3SM06_THIDA|nr:TIGR04063 family PEP-CTERM/XrtA system glycosyltransferase [Thiobacillus denitrificans]AAZ96246.1 glycosyl transferase, group 1 [Thiobacillus denitrificans ATCC 25259]
MKILHVFDHTLPLHSGYTFRSAAILRNQQKLGWQTFHLSGPKQVDCSVAEEDADGLHFYRTPRPEGVLARLPGGDPFAVMAAIEKRLLPLARELRPDVLHAHSPVLDAMPALRVGRKLGIPVVYEIRAFWEDAAVDHGSTTEGSLRYRLTRALETRAVKQADAVTVICEGLRADLVARGIPAGKITVIPNAVDVDKFAVGGQADPELKMKLGLGASRVLGFIGSFYAYEGLDLLIGALPAITARAPDVKVLLVGGGPQDAALKAQVMALGLKDRVVFAGRVPHAEVNRYYDLVDVLVYARHPMRLTELVTPLKPLEAMAQGRLMVASDVGGHRELIDDGKTGVLFRAGDADDLARKAVALLDNASDWERIKANGRRFVETERNWAASVARYRGVYQRLVQTEAVLD